MLVLLYLISIILYQAFAEGAKLPVTTSKAKALVAKYKTEARMQQYVRGQLTKAYCASAAMRAKTTVAMEKNELGWEVDLESVNGIADMKEKQAEFKKLICAKGFAYCVSMLVLIS